MTPEEEKEEGRHYLPLLFVGKRDDSVSTTKTQLIQDPSNQNQWEEICFNDVQISAPDIENPLLGLLMRSRTLNAIGLGDIEKFYFKISLHPNQRKYTCLYAKFYEETQKFAMGNPEAKWFGVQMNVISMGTKQSPSLSKCCIRKLAEEVRKTDIETAQQIDQS